MAYVTQPGGREQSACLRTGLSSDPTEDSRLVKKCFRQDQLLRVSKQSSRFVPRGRGRYSPVSRASSSAGEASSSNPSATAKRSELSGPTTIAVRVSPNRRSLP